MGKFRMSLAVLVVLLSALIVSNGDGDVILCNMTKDGLNSCKPAVTAPNPSAPTSDCCSALSSANLTCLCSYKDSWLLPTLGIDPGLAMKLPQKCNLNPPEQC